MIGHDEPVDCPICLEPMNESDHQHALMCTTKQCDFNFCHSCIESLITSSKDEYVEASDGNKHVKVWLHCPNCRSDLGPTIRETLLLRKADFLLNSEYVPDEQLTASQLRMRSVMGESEVKKAIELARKREKDFFKEKYPDGDYSVNCTNEDDELLEEGFEYEEWGVEADLGGVHLSFRMPKGEQTEEVKMKVDKTLCGGLDFCMSEPEQIYITELLTSGDANKLAQAAEIMHGVLNMDRVGPPPEPKLKKRSSVFELIQEAEQAYYSGKGAPPAPAVARTPTPAQIRASMKRRTDFLKTHPLPIRMPKHVVLTIPEQGDKLGLRFCDDTWNGTVMDAFSKITISGKKVKKKRSMNRGVMNVLSQGKNPDQDFGDARIDVESHRVLVSSVKGEGGRLGILKGDVVTHLNGEEFLGSAATLEARIQTLSEQKHGNNFTLVLNAESSVAEALRRRALIGA